VTEREGEMEREGGRAGERRERKKTRKERESFGLPDSAIADTASIDHIRQEA
jgi:hypothetical protein